MKRLTPEQARSYSLCRHCRSELTPDTYCPRCASQIARVVGPVKAAALGIRTKG